MLSSQMNAALSYIKTGYTLMYEPANTERGYKMALVSIKDLKAAIAVMRDILEKLDQIYHVLHDNNSKKE